jgi:hypothetical protein
MRLIVDNQNGSPGLHTASVSSYSAGRVRKFLFVTAARNLLFLTSYRATRLRKTPRTAGVCSALPTPKVDTLGAGLFCPSIAQASATLDGNPIDRHPPAM